MGNVLSDPKHSNLFTLHAACQVQVFTLLLKYFSGNNGVYCGWSHVRFGLPLVFWSTSDYHRKHWSHTGLREDYVRDLPVGCNTDPSKKLWCQKYNT